MAKDIYEFRLKLLEKIQRADSEDKIIRLIETALVVLTKNSVHGHLIIRFLDKMIVDIENYDNGKLMLRKVALEKLHSIKKSISRQDA